MPGVQTDVKLAEEFPTFFLEKIEDIHDKFREIEEFKPSTNEQLPLYCNEVHKEILSMNNKTYELD